MIAKVVPHIDKGTEGWKRRIDKWAKGMQNTWNRDKFFCVMFIREHRRRSWREEDLEQEAAHSLITGTQQ